MMPSEEKKPISSCSGRGPITDSTNAGWLYRCGSIDSLERLQRPVAGRKELKAAGDIALNDADAFASSCGRNGGGEA